MVIPQGVDYGNFYREAKKKGIKITSRYPNVYVWEGHRDSGLFWMASWGNSKKDPRYLRKSFPFTEVGERSAKSLVTQHAILYSIRQRKPKKHEDSKIL